MRCLAFHRTGHHHRRKSRSRPVQGLSISGLGSRESTFGRVGCIPGERVDGCAGLHLKLGGSQDYGFPEPMAGRWCQDTGTEIAFLPHIIQCLRVVTDASEIIL